MPTIEVTRAGGAERLTVETGVLLAEALHMGGHTIDLPCGGAGICGHCQVQAKGKLSAPSPAEKALWGADMPTEGARLACQCAVLGDARVTLSQPGPLAQILTASTGAAATLAGSPFYQTAGLAADIGTTTMAGTLFIPGRPPLSAAVQNPQTRFGADVITRIRHALDGEAAVLAKAAQDGLKTLAQTLTDKAGLRFTDIDGVVVTGNTAMLTLLTGTDTEPLSHAPFSVKRHFGEFLPAHTILPDAAPGARAYLPRCVSAFVGADITTALLATGLWDTPHTALLLDIGTNGEVALWHNNELTCCSTAAGPAFEGSGIECGVYAVPSAIDKVWLQGGELRATTISRAPAVGLCGSGIIDLMALLLRTGVVDETGAFQASGHPFVSRLESVRGQPALRLAPGVVFTAKDVRQVQLAKAAIRAGVETLLAHAGVRPGGVTRFCIAGGFGHYLNLENAATVGLLPAWLLPRAEVAGNAALDGAGIMVQNMAEFPLSKRIACAASTVDLSANPVFQAQYMQQMLFE